MILTMSQKIVHSNLENFLSTTDVLIVAVVVFALTKAILSWIETRKYPPGPWGLPIVGYLPFLGREPHKILYKLKGKFGNIIRLKVGPSYLVVLNEYNVAKDVICQPAALDRQPNAFDHISEIGFIKANGEEWTEQRRYFFTTAKDLGWGRHQWEDNILEDASRFASYLRSKKGSPTDIARPLNLSIANSIVSFLIGRSLHEEKEADKMQMLAHFSEAAIRYMGPACVASYMPGVRRILQVLKVAGYDWSARIIEETDEFFKNEISHHKTGSPGSKDFIGMYLGKIADVDKSSRGRSYFSERMLRGDLNLIFLAAQDTTFNSMSFLLRLMAAHGDVQSRVHAELARVLGADRRARYGDRHAIPYTFAVVMEALRFSTIVPIPVYRRANQDIHIHGYTIPKGSDIGMNVWALHNDPDYWEKPEQFLPERFIAEGGKLIQNPPSYVPFGMGKRDCPGRTIAYMEILSYFTEIIRQFQISTKPNEETNFQCVPGLVLELVPQELCFNPR